MKYGLNVTDSTQMFLCKPKEDGSKTAEGWLICDFENVGEGLEPLKGFATMMLSMDEVANLVVKHLIETVNSQFEK